jgi:hypothetical protein
MLRGFACTAFATLLLVTPQAQTSATIHVWKVGSPYTGDTPSTNTPPALAREAVSRGWRLHIEGFPAAGFVGRFFAAVSDGSAPDLLVFDNFVVMDGGTTGLGSFVGIGQDPAIRDQLIQVTGSFDELLGPTRGWTFLLTSSANHAPARELALRTPRCAGVSSTASLPADLANVIPEVATAYLTGDSAGMLSHVDPERLSGVRQKVERVTIGGAAVCGEWGNERLAFVTLNVSYQADTRIGHVSLLLAFRKPSTEWQLLVATRDPVSNRDFVRLLPALAKALTRDIAAGQVPEPATLRSPQDGRFPFPAKGQRFGDFEWQSSTAETVVAEVAEFSYGDDARLFLLPTKNPSGPRHVSAGQLWTTRGEWAWRVWTISQSGEIAFSKVRTFVH